MQLILSFMPPAGAKGDETGKVDMVLEEIRKDFMLESKVT